MAWYSMTNTSYVIRVKTGLLQGLLACGIAGKKRIRRQTAKAAMAIAGALVLTESEGRDLEEMLKDLLPVARCSDRMYDVKSIRLKIYIFFSFFCSFEFICVTA